MPPIDTLAGTDTESEPDDLRGDIASLFEAAEKEPDVAEASGAADVPAIEGQEAQATDGRTRDEHGRFAPKAAEKQIDVTVEAKAPDKDLPSTDAVKASTDLASKPVSAPPTGWTAAEKAEWQKLPPAVQAAVSRRENEMSRGGQQWSEEKRRYETVLSPVAQEAQRLGMSVDQAINGLMAAHHKLNQNAPRALRELASQYGVDLATLAGQSAADGSRENPQPDITALVNQAVAPLLAPIQQRIAMEENQRQQSTLDLVNTFSTSPGHEHFEAIQSELMDLIPGIKSRNPSWTHEKILQEAYDRAVYANPQTRATLLAGKEAEAEAKRVTDAKARTANARRAGVSVTGSPNGSAAPQAKDSLRAEIEAAMSGGQP